MKLARRLTWFAQILIAVLVVADVRAQPTALDGRTLDTVPRVVKKPNLEYPEFLLKLGNIHGTVRLQFVIDEQGKANAPKVLQTSHPGFVAPAIDAFLNTSFAPGTIKGVPVATRTSSGEGIDTASRLGSGELGASQYEPRVS